MILEARLDSRDGARLQHRQEHALLAFELNDVGLRRSAVVHIGNIAHIDHGAVDDLDGQIVEFLDPFRRIVEIDCIFELPDFLGADEPVTDCDSICSISLTVVVSERS